jgi:hypothetical protein
MTPPRLVAGILAQDAVVSRKPSSSRSTPGRCNKDDQCGRDRSSSWCSEGALPMPFVFVVVVRVSRTTTARKAVGLCR